MTAGSFTSPVFWMLLVLVTLQVTEAWMLQPRSLIRSQSAFSSVRDVRRSSRSIDTILAQTAADSTENTAEPSAPAAPTNQKGRIVVIEVPLGDGFGPVKIQFRPIFAKSTFYVTSYDVPFGLNIDRPPDGFPAPLVKKAGKGGEQEGDALRGCTSWSQGFSAAGATADISMFAGSIKLRKSVFDCTLAPWDKVVEALTSNTAERSKTVTLIFEREVE